MGYYLLENKNRCAINAGYPGFWGYTTRNNEIQLAVIHTGEIAADMVGPDMTAENLSRYAAFVCDRRVSWHATTDADSIIEMIPDSYTGFHVRDYNSRSLGVEQGIKASEWAGLEPAHRNRMIKNLATVVGGWCDDHGLEKKRISKTEADNGVKGIIAHADLDPGRRSDPGPDFPWNLLMKQLDTTSAPPVPKTIYIYSSNPNKGGAATAQYISDGVTKRVIKIEEKPWLEYAFGVPNVGPQKIGWELFTRIVTVSE